MKLGIISDTHDRVDRTRVALALLHNEGIDALVHAGDLTTPEVVFEFGEVPSYFVYGNNDWNRDGIKRAVAGIEGVLLDYGGEFTLGDKRIAVTHGDSARELQRLSNANPDVLIFGHTHQYSDERVGVTRWINPGALHRAVRKTVAVLDLDTGELRFIDVEQAY